MANRVKIAIVDQPANLKKLKFQLQDTAIGFDKTIEKIFVSGFPSSTTQVKIGLDAEETLAFLFANLESYTSDPNIVYSISYPFIYIDFVVPDTYTVTLLIDADGAFEVDTETVSAPVPDVLDPLNIESFQITITDTYTNALLMIVEYAKESACQIKWEGGDDLFKDVMSSSLEYNMRVANFEDAHFIHLLTGDEQRYRVQLIALDVLNTAQLVWQGYILPDQYKEPYTNNNLFVDFTASDMINAMKGKYFPSWYYNNRLPVSEVLALALANTGLSQNLIVVPAIEPDSAFFGWDSITVDLNMFEDNGKFKDCYTIVSDLATSLGLSLYSFRGYWWFEGIQRRKETAYTALQFDTDGKRIQDIEVTKVEVEAFMQAEAPVFTAITQNRKVNLGFNAKGTKNLFTDTVVKLPQDMKYNSFYTTGNVVPPALAHPYGEMYSVSMVPRWKSVLNSDFMYLIGNTGQVMWKTLLPSGYDNYNYTEAMALTNYLECNEKPFVKPGVLYELELGFTVEHMIVSVADSPGEMKIKLQNGDYDKLFPWQLFIDGVEKFSNRPTMTGENVRFEATDNPSGFGGQSHTVNFKLKFQFRTEVKGYLSFRVLMPIFENGPGAVDGIEDQTNLNFNCFFMADALKLTAIEGYDENDDITAYRNINFTQELDYELPISCTVDNSVTNSFGIGRPVSANYFPVIDRTDTAYVVWAYHFYAPGTALQLDYATWKITYDLLEQLFGKGKKSNAFLESTSGVQYAFDSLWFHFNNPLCRMGYLTAKEGYPNIPKDYRYYPFVSGSDVLKYMDVRYAPENYSQRLLWKATGVAATDSFPRIMGKILHGVQPEMIYRLEGTQLGLVWPNDLLTFYYDNVDRDFIPTRIGIDLFNAKSQLTAIEAKFADLTDIIYE